MIDGKTLDEMRKRRNDLRGTYSERNELFKKYEDIYFLDNIEKPKGGGLDKNDWKLTVSPAGRDKVTGMKRILDTSEIHIKVKDGEYQHSDKIEAGLKTMLRVSGEYRAARVEKDTNLASVLYGPCVLTVESLDDLIVSKTKDKDKNVVNKFVLNQLNIIKKRTPFLLGTVNPKESFPEWGEYGMSGHMHEYTVKGSILREQWGTTEGDDARDYVVQDYFHYDKRLVEAQGFKDPLFADTWLVEKNGTYAGVTSIPVFVRNAGGSTLFHETEKELQSFLYAYAKGEWANRENLLWTYLFTAIYTQGLPGPTIIRDPEDTSDIRVDYKGGVKIITMKGKLENVNVIDSDVIQLKNMMDQQTNMSTIQEQTIGGGNPSDTFSSYVMQMNAGKLPLMDPREAIEYCYRDAFLHILQRIKAENIENDLIEPALIPDDIELEVTYEPRLQQDDLRNAQIVSQLKGSGANISDEWIDTNLLKIANSMEMFKQKTKEDFRRAIVGRIIQDPQLLQQFVMAAMGGQQTPPPPPPPPQGSNGRIPSEMTEQMEEPPMMPGAGGEGMPQTDAMIQQNERM